MFEVNDRIVYGTHGVCKVKAIGRLAISMADKKKQYYTLSPVYQRDEMIYVPVDANKINMRQVHSKEEIELLIAEIAEIENEWNANDREREAQYKEALISGDCRQLIKMIKTLYQRKESRALDGKKVASVDERYFQQAEEQLYGELAYVLDMEKDEISSYIADCITKQTCLTEEKV